MKKLQNFDTRYRTNYYYDRDQDINGGVDKSFIERKAGYRIAEEIFDR